MWNRLKKDLNKENANPLALHFALRSPCTLCFAKIGGGSAKKMKIQGFSFCFALALHYLCPQIKFKGIKI